MTSLIPVYSYVNELIKNRFRQSENIIASKDSLVGPIFNKFIYGWISFNAFYSAVGKKEGEAQNIKVIARMPECQNIFNNLVNSSEIIAFHNYILNREREVFGYTTLNGVKGGIINVQEYDDAVGKIESFNAIPLEIRHFSDEDVYKVIHLTTSGKEMPRKLLQQYNNIADLNAFLMTIYQIRCNLFHGSKDPEEEADRLIVFLAGEALNCFLSSLYKHTSEIVI